MNKIKNIGKIILSFIIIMVSILTAGKTYAKSGAYTKRNISGYTEFTFTDANNFKVLGLNDLGYFAYSYPDDFINTGAFKEATRNGSYFLDQLGGGNYGGIQTTRNCYWSVSRCSDHNTANFAGHATSSNMVEITSYIDLDINSSASGDNRYIATSHDLTDSNDAGHTTRGAYVKNLLSAIVATTKGIPGVYNGQPWGQNGNWDHSDGGGYASNASRIATYYYFYRLMLNDNTLNLASHYGGLNGGGKNVKSVAYGEMYGGGTAYRLGQLAAGIGVGSVQNVFSKVESYEPITSIGGGTFEAQNVEKDKDNVNENVKVFSSTTTETIVGPFKLNHTAGDVESVTVEGVTGTASDDKVLCSKSKDKDWQKIDKIPVNVDFYLKVKGNFTKKQYLNVSFKQKGSDYYKGRMVFAYNRFSWGQSMMYFAATKAEGNGNTITYRVRNVGTIKIRKRDLELKGPVDFEFKILAKDANGNEGWVKSNGDGTYTYNINVLEPNNAETFKTEKGDKDVEQLSVLYKYTIYETEILDEHYFKKDQPGYGEDPRFPDYVVGTPKEVELIGDNIECEFIFPNISRVTIRGYVWADGKGKGAEYDSIYAPTEGGIYYDKKIGGVKVYLVRKSDNKAIVETVTNNAGAYEFDREILYHDLNKYYVAFDYADLTIQDYNGKDRSGKEFIPVAYNSKNLDKIINDGSRAMMDEIKEKDADLVNKESGNGGYATTYKGTNETELATYGLWALKDKLYENYVLHDINLGIKPIYIPDYKIFEDLYYVKVRLNNHEYAYKYNEEQLELPAVPKVDVTSYNRPIYPSAIYDLKQGENTEGQIKLYAVYQMRIENSTTHDEEELYREQRLHLTSLTNEFDKSKYTLDTSLTNTEEKDTYANVKDIVVKDIPNWTETSGEGGKGIATYNLDSRPIVINPGEYVNRYIQLRVQDEEVKRILTEANNTVSETTTAKARGYHDYKRKDYSWKNMVSKEQNHKTVDEERKDTAPDLILMLGQERVLTGTVFKDNKVTTEEVLGNGQHEITEDVIENVKVEVVHGTDFENGTPTIVYVGNKGDKSKYEIKPASTTTNNKGKFTISGLMPGEYYLRLTYGDGTQIIWNPDGTKTTGRVSIGEHKSTIITSKVVRNALGYDTNKYGNEWYKYVEADNYSVAVDSLNTRAKCAEENPPKEISAGSALMDITIENTKDPYTVNGNGMQEETFGGMNFGIIEQAKQKVEIHKTITDVGMNNTPNVLFKGNPQDGDLPGVTDLDGNDDNQGSTYTRMEVASENIYGSEFTLKYNVTVRNVSDVNYYETDKKYTGWYYKFGAHSTKYSDQIRINVKDVIDCYDPVLTDSTGEKSNGKNIETVKITREGEMALAENKYETKTVRDQERIALEKYNEEYKYKEVLRVTGWKLLQNNYRNPDNSWDSVVLQFGKVLSTENDDLDYLNGAGVAEAVNSVAEEHLSNETAQFTLKFARPVELPPPSFAEAVISAPTGDNKQLMTTIYLLSAVVGLTAIAVGLVIYIKKKK